MKRILFFILFIPTVIHARCESFTRFGKPQTICWHQELKAYVSESCLKTCDATDFLLKKHPRPQVIDRQGGKNPATQYCKHFDLRVHVLKDPGQAEQSFCVFPDGSLVDANAVARSLK